VSTFAVVLVVIAALLVLLVLGGIVASGRAAQARETRLKAEVEQADRALAQAHAGDNGWDAAQMEAAARTAWSSGHHASEPIAALHLVQVIDRPGTDADEAVYRVVGAGGHEHDVVLKRSGGSWRT
jgi:cytochrome c556